MKFSIIPTAVLLAPVLIQGVASAPAPNIFAVVMAMTDKMKAAVDAAKGPTEITLYGTQTWVPYQSYNNPENGGPVNFKVKFTKSSRVKRSEFSKDTFEEMNKKSKSQTTSFSLGASYSIVSVGVEHSTTTASEVNTFVSSVTEKSKEEETSSSEDHESEFTVNPGQNLTLYQVVFRGPGMDYKSGFLTNVFEKEKRIPIKVTLERKSANYLRAVDVAYTDNEGDMPNDAVQEINSQSADINKDHKGKFVYLIPRWTANANDACTTLDYFRQKNEHPDFKGKSISEGAKGDKRYLRCVKDTRNQDKITILALMREKKKVELGSVKSATKGEFDHMSEDLNEGRGKSHLYVVYKTAKAESGITFA